jgi:hypothetical protein
LKDGAVKVDQIFFYQSVSGLKVLIHGHLQQAADRIVTVKRKPVSVACQHKKKVQEQLVWI